jgi:hypothetical protein
VGRCKQVIQPYRRNAYNHVLYVEILQSCNKRSTFHSTEMSNLLRQRHIMSVFRHCRLFVNCEVFDETIWTTLPYMFERVWQLQSISAAPSLKHHVPGSATRHAGEGKPLRSDYMHIILYIVRASSCVHIPTRITDLKPQSVLHVIHFIVPSHHLVAMHS